MEYFALTIQPSFDDDDEERGYFDFNITNREIVSLRWYDGVSLADLGIHTIELTLNDMNGWASEFPDYSNTPVPLMTKKLADCLSAAGVSNIETYEVRILSAPPDCPEYRAFNVVGSVMAADPSKSEFHRVMGVPGADVYEKLVLDRGAISSLDLFRMAESVSTVIVSNRIRKAIESCGLTSVGFEPVAVAT